MHKITEGLQYFPVFQNRCLNGFTSENKIFEIYYFKKKIIFNIFLFNPVDVECYQTAEEYVLSAY